MKQNTILHNTVTMMKEMVRHIASIKTLMLLMLMAAGVVL